MRTVALLLTMMLGLLGCNGSQTGPDACIAAGGRCVPGSAINMCASRGTPDCNPDRNPGGAFCCIAFLDAGGDANANAADGGDDVAPGEASAPDAAAATESGSTFECGDASCLASSQFCYHVIGGVPPGVDNQSCQALPPPASECADGGHTGCSCMADSGALYVFCAVP
jgi:hypothetical protein